MWLLIYFVIIYIKMIFSFEYPLNMVGREDIFFYFTDMKMEFQWN